MLMGSKNRSLPKIGADSKSVPFAASMGISISGTLPRQYITQAAGQKPVRRRRHHGPNPSTQLRERELVGDQLFVLHEKGDPS